MGAWGNRNFENDDAADFADEFLDNPTDAALVEAMTVVVKLGEDGAYIESGEATNALAAAEIVAASIGRLSADFPDKLRDATKALQTGTDPEIRNLARQAVMQVVKESELQELWADAEDGEPKEWQAVQQDLLTRLE